MTEMSTMIMGLQATVHGKAGRIYIGEDPVVRALQFTDTVFSGTRLSPMQAREMARQLYRLARRVEKRQGAAS